MEFNYDGTITYQKMDIVLLIVFLLFILGPVFFLVEAITSGRITSFF